jgi:hypothetical protein
MKIKLKIVLTMLFATTVWAKPAPDLVFAIRQVFTPADSDRSFVSSQLPLTMNKVHGFAVVKKTGIPAAYAYWFITRQDYEYRPLVIKGGLASTYAGKVDVTLEPGTIMVISGLDVFQKTVQLKLLSKDVVASLIDKPERRDTRAAVALTFKFPDLKMTAEDASAILARMEEYVAPADSLTQAEQIASQIRGTPLPPPSRGGGQGAGDKVAPPPVPAKAPAVAAPKVATPVAKTPGVVQTGMGMDEVRQIKGEPKRILNRGSTITYDYGDHDVIFAQGKVSDIRWK